MRKYIKMSELEQLCIDNLGNITLKGEIVSAKPIGSPFHIEMKRLPHENSGYWSWNLYEKIFEETLEVGYFFPEKANAFIREEPHLTRSIQGKIKLSEDVRVVSIQPYQILNNRGIQNG